MASKIDDVITPKEVGQSLASTLIDDATRGCTSDQMTFQLASLHEAAITILGTQLFNYARIDGWDQDRKAKHIHEIVQGIIDLDDYPMEGRFDMTFVTSGSHGTPEEHAIQILTKLEDIRLR